ncbi:cation transporter [Kingella kingae]|uniref:cation transporter n=1 Tax=Kingella TaxID=32257 RepID=UPI001412B218|nr:MULTISPECIES: cation transporter [Kingella]MDK4563992.1 cation transporter [Kingella kingae]MDK4567031.1 cation transporter [Kingella kingae]MDK4577946.1 cation transporter [Kingella kingae]MDK4591229.1 cation transporter [Kingella kingae]MDK4607991.1 cation transporter [Kingella kingae]
MACCHHTHETHNDVTPTYRKVLIVALVVNFTMFLLEIFMGMKAGAVSLFADSMDFFGDAANYTVSLFLLSSTLQTRAKMSLIKGGSMLIFGVIVLISTMYYFIRGELPHSGEMGAIGALALLANVSVAVMLYRFRTGDSNMQSVWLCSRNDAIGNVAVMIAATCVYFTQSQLPDLIVALMMAALAIQSGWQVVKLARKELQAA